MFIIRPKYFWHVVIPANDECIILGYNGIDHGHMCLISRKGIIRWQIDYENNELKGPDRKL